MELMQEAVGQKNEFGDFQTPLELAELCCQVAKRRFGQPGVVVEPTCGKGGFLLAAAKTFGDASLYGFELNSKYVAAARRLMRRQDSDERTKIRKRDFFAFDWHKESRTRSESVLYIGNPPWVTNSDLGRISSRNLPSKSNRQRVRGIEAITGKSNFDIAESILQTLLGCMRVDIDTMAMLVKTQTARKVIAASWNDGQNFSHLSIHHIDTKKHFGVNVDACLILAKRSARKRIQICKQASELGRPAKETAFGFHNGQIVSDPRLAKSTSHLVGDNDVVWRSGIKHDIAPVLELRINGKQLTTREGQPLDLESEMVFPLAKGSDVANDRVRRLSNRILLTQKSINDDCESTIKRLPKTWRYLKAHSATFARRKSSIYRNRDPYAIFGIGSYSFAPWKVAICGLYKTLTFTVIGPRSGKPVMLDDTCYFLPFRCRKQATCAAELLRSPPAMDFFQSRIFWDSKRPITAATLRLLDLNKLARTLGKPIA